mgnify:CR=1 FL=1
MTRETPTLPFALFALFALCALSMACGQTEEADDTGPVDAPDGSDVLAETSEGETSPTCEPGRVMGPEDTCISVGIQGCVDLFVDPETGLCGPDPALCDEGEIPVASEGCVSLDPPGGCGEGTWGELALFPGDVHVDPNTTSEDPDGSRENPWPLIAYALGKVEDGGRIVLAAGEYDEGVILAKSVDLVGRCSSMVEIVGTTTAFTAAPTGVLSGEFSSTTSAASEMLGGLEVGGGRRNIGPFIGI